MTQFNPNIGSILQSGQVARQQAAAKSAAIRRNQLLQKNVAQRDDELEHQVESSEELGEAHDKDGKGRKKREPEKGKQGDQETHLDVRA